jgi:TRAP-type C4-dicarboxylate transport system permease small subunit
MEEKIALEEEALQNEKPPMAEKIPLIWKIEEGICYVFMAFLALLPAGEAVARILIRTGIPSSSDFIIHFLLVVGLVSGMICTRKKRHLAITVVENFCPEKVKNGLAILSSLISVFTATALVWCGASFVRRAFEPGTLIGFIPVEVFAMVIPIGYAVMAFRFARLTPVSGWMKLLPVLAVILATACSLPIIGKFIWYFDMPEVFWDLSDFFYNLTNFVKIPVTIFLIVAALAGVPLFITMGAFSLFLIQA